MKIFKWLSSNLTVKKAGVRVANACYSNSFPYPFVYIFDGKVGMTVEFQTKEELDVFKKQVNKLEIGKTQ